MNRVKRWTAGCMTAVLVVTGSAGGAVPWLSVQSAYAEEAASALPIVAYEKKTDSTVPQDVPVALSVFTETALVSATLYYRNGKAEAFDSMPMTIGEPVDGYAPVTGVIPQQAMLDAASIDYYFEIGNANGVTRSPAKDDAAYDLVIEQPAEPVEPEMPANTDPESEPELEGDLATSQLAAATTPSLLITEIVFNAPNTGEKSEYIEVYNNSAAAANLSDYYVYYENFDGTKSYQWRLPSQELGPWQTVALLGKSSNLATVNSDYGVTLTEQQIAIMIQDSGNLINTGTYTAQIRTVADHQILSSARYNDATISNTESGDDQDKTSVTYKFNPDSGAMERWFNFGVPTPGTVLAGQVPDPVAADPSALAVITHTPIGTTPLQEATVTASVSSPSALQSATLYFKDSGQQVYKSIEMAIEPGENTYTLSGTIGLSAIHYSANMDYYLTVVNGEGLARSESYKLTVDRGNPNLLITEIVFNAPGDEESEFIEVYNNSAETIKLSDYYVYYENYNGTTTYKWLLPEDKELAPWQSIVLLRKISSLSLVNSAYGVSLTESQIALMKQDSGNLVNTGTYMASIKSIADDRTISSARYNDIAIGPKDVTDSGDRTSVLYHYQAGAMMAKLVSKQTPTPGTLLDGQVPLPQVEDPTKLPAVTYEPAVTSTTPQDVTVTAAVTSVSELKNARMFYKAEFETFYNIVQMTVTKKEDGTYTVSAVIPASAMAAAGKIEYYFMIENETGVTQNPSGTGAAYALNVEREGEPSYLLITEMVFNGPNVNGVDIPAWEYIELYNNSDKTISLQDYYIDYTDLNGVTQYIWQFKDNVRMEPGRTLVLRMEPTDDNGSVESFNTAYKLTGERMIAADDLVDLAGESSLANTSPRVVTIKTKSGLAVVSAAYNDTATTDNPAPDNLTDTSVTYLPNYVSSNMVKWGVKVAPTPGAVVAGQVPAVPVSLPGDYLPPVIEHTRAAGTIAAKDWPIAAQFKDDTAVTAAKLFYKTDLTADYVVLPMSLKEGSTYEAVVPAAALKGATKLYYYFEASDGVQSSVKKGVQDKPFEINVLESLSSIVPPLLITELVPDDVGSDAYEYIEVYNNSTQPVNLKDYQIVYGYYHGGTDKWDMTQDFELPAGETAVIWVQSDLSKGEPVSKFNAHWGVNLPQNRVMAIYSLGMNNASEGRIILAEDSHYAVDHARNPIVQAWFSVGIDEVDNDGTSVVYEYPKDGTTKMVKRSARMQATPGVLLEAQVPEQLVQVPDDTVKPTIEHAESTEEVPFGSLSFEATAKDDQLVKRISLFFKRDKDSAYKEVNMKRTAAGSNLFLSAEVNKALLLGAEQVNYYFEATDGQNIVRSNDYSLTFEDQGPLWVEFADGGILSGTAFIYGNTATAGETLNLSVDGAQLETKAAMHLTPTITYRADDMQASFKNGLFVNDELVTILPASTYYQQKYVDIPKHVLKPGENTIKITAGTAADPLEFGTATNNDDYRIEGVELLLPDGSSAAWTSARSKTLNANTFTAIDPADRHKVGDSSGYVEYIEITFNVPASMFDSVYAELDTTALTDGEHAFQLSAASGNVTETAVVDNTAPTFDSFSIEDGKLYSGAIELQAAISDALAGVASVTATLDGKPIELPVTVQASELFVGEHIFAVTATDNAGNTTTRKGVFETEEEAPNSPFNPTPAEGATNISRQAVLSVTANDPNGGQVDVTFGQGYRYDFNEQSDIAAYANAVDREPPLELNPAGEAAFTAEAKALVAKQDGEYFVTDANGLFPYQRYEFKLDQDAKGIADIEVVWKGHSLAGRQVTMYTWNYTTGKWEAAARGVGAEDFELRATVAANEMVRDQAIQVLIQDMIVDQAAAEPADDPDGDGKFTFAFSTDTQYYADSYPDIFRSQMEYVAAMKDELDIRYLIHTGDIVDDWDRPDEWAVADESFKVIEEAGLPYGVVAGNHDVNHANADYTEYWKYFGRDRFEVQPTYGDDLNNNRDHYDLVSANGQDFLIMYLGWNVQEDTVKWANDILQKYPDRYAIIGTHEYISPSGAYSGQGQMIWDEIVAKNANVKLVLCGHIHGVGYNVKHLEDGRVVVEMLADYQSGPMGGQGYMRFLEFDPAKEQIQVKTYSPYMNDYNYYEDGSDEFTIPFVTQDPAKQVATDYIGVNLYGTKTIGTKQTIQSDGAASVTWSGLAANSDYYWYAKATDQAGTSTLSPIWKFTTGTSGGSSGGSNPDGGNSGGNNSGNTGSGNDGGDGSQTNPSTGSEWTRLTAADIAASGDTVQLTDNGTSEGIVFTAEALQAIGQRNVTIRLANGSVITISAAKLSELAGKLGSGEELYVSTKLPSSQAINQAAAQYGTSRKASFTIAGDFLELGFGKRGGDSATESPLTAPVTIELAASGVSDERLAGIYRIAEDGTVAFIGGTYQDGRYTATVEQAGTYVVLAYSKLYTDVKPEHWAYSYVQLLSFEGVTTGITDNTFGAAQTTTRAEFVTLLARAFRLQPSTGSLSFRDVEAGSWYAEAVQAAYEAGIVQGISADRFEPGQEITREEMVVMVIRALELRSGTIAAAGSGASFADGEQISAWAKDAVSKAIELGLISGKGNNNFDPHGMASRAETAKVIALMLEHMQ
ncbi:hypothetical protein FHS18_006687 [Paenibacillus phyllosphaerae]|uniref:Metallophosphoesterase n=1 Tax=Paenibacillus phyllosphaerae TaxID=274593 RepID=A0A7W5FRH9_9BACL|nr:lamin tail domain-containing protein [Paenibacillus phyllosphaerae]MBB3114566.1 hypothetical protein [Paenibacillus phyllosphaerae]